MVIIKNKNVIILTLIFLVMFTLNLLTPLFADDFNYSFMWDKSKKIENLIDVVKSQQMHYVQWGGRTVAHTLGQTLLMTSKLLRSFLNALVYVALIYLIYWHSQGKKLKFSRNVSIVLLIALLCWVSLPSFGETTIWLIGSVNYLWTTVIMLLFLIPYRLKLLSNAVFVKDNIIQLLGMFIMGILAGWSNENTSLLVLILTAIAVVYFLQKRMMGKWMLAGFAGTMIGYLFLILAPGNMVRASHMEKPADYSFLLYHIKVPAFMTISIMKFQVPVWIAFIMIMSVLLNYLVRNKLSFKNMLITYGHDFLYSFTFIGFSILNNLIMFASPQFPLRAGFGSSVFLIIGVLGLLRIEVTKRLFNIKIVKTLNIATICFLIVTMGFVIRQYSILYHENNARMNSLNNEKQTGNDSVIVKPFSIDKSSPYQTLNRHVFISDIGGNPNVWPNTIYAQYYGFKSIKELDH
ncbi:hypothetical protein BC351_11595 [Paenibacillus ferrarius]|uniref:Uncharacterized protein n=1 Tax=Paenibacillus ferrarius TaxID=1469647 RepID=A0A1V4H7M8_9BACL|nr:DUF6056 family protein [Paenibacillus ferrarius]OPH47144.1 hypothetical protein BC351_11595 [Paenibacillus ferrarius]